ncbi:topoisomerase DNA-binding C4 zinc finger domain-containing protein [Paenibacillus crassostreae]|uniref:topoisomerase DNA-binding C4 zinc finger domain-containing protein n=1 Tax=Paenibacillus crassostreae TaxID=1763538 RepID=UPI0009ED712E|nr:topoisomerase DNA-binding C4 zinc finger domain-containing protein [Paenibacillus crassostreae]
MVKSDAGKNGKVAAFKAYNTNRYVEILKQPKVCSVCGGFIVRKNGKFGPFDSCSNYPRCKSKE